MYSDSSARVESFTAPPTTDIACSCKPPHFNSRERLLLGPPHPRLFPQPFLRTVTIDLLLTPTNQTIPQHCSCQKLSTRREHHRCHQPSPHRATRRCGQEASPTNFLPLFFLRNRTSTSRRSAFEHHLLPDIRTGALAAVPALNVISYPLTNFSVQLCMIIPQSTGMRQTLATRGRLRRRRTRAGRGGTGEPTRPLRWTRVPT